MHAILKSEAIKRFNRGEIVYFMPSRFDANQCIYAPEKIKKTELLDGVSFQEYIKDYEENNCNNNVGNKVKFWAYPDYN